MKQHDLSALSAAFDELANTRLKDDSGVWIPGVWVAHSAIPGPVVGITF